MTEAKEYKLRDYSPFTWVLERFFRALQFLPPQCILQPRSEIETPRDKAKTAARARQVELYVTVWLLVEATLGLLFIAFSISPWWIWVLITLRLIDIMQTSVNVAVFDQLRGRQPHIVASIPRTLVLTFVNFLEIMICFGLVYVTMLGNLCGAAHWPDAFYFSVVTQLTIGYGDIHPVGPAKLLAVTQGVTGVIIIVIVLGRVIAALRKFDEVFPSNRHAA